MNQWQRKLTAASLVKTINPRKLRVRFRGHVFLPLDEPSLAIVLSIKPIDIDERERCIARSPDHAS